MLRTVRRAPLMPHGMKARAGPLVDAGCGLPPPENCVQGPWPLVCRRRLQLGTPYFAGRRDGGTDKAPGAVPWGQVLQCVGCCGRLDKRLHTTA